MKAREVAEVVIAALGARSPRFIRANFANGDMVGHTGSLQAAVAAMEVVDECVGRVMAAVEDAGATLIVTADHGNAEMMWEVEDRATGRLKLDENGQPLAKTSHTLSPVPWCLWGRRADEFRLNEAVEEPGLANIAATLLLLLGYEGPPDYLPPLIVRRQ
jgi:2,3-bisphosphoglycerate-independent phosphoglycerate mutase